MMALTSGKVVSLPMRDGNREPAFLDKIALGVVSLPMRDGNPPAYQADERAKQLLAYL